MSNPEPAPPAVSKNLPKPKPLVPQSQGVLERLIRVFLASEGVTPSRFGRDVMGDPMFLTRWERDRPTWHARTRLKLTKFFLDRGYLTND
jgi:hypothetical protein